MPDDLGDQLAFLQYTSGSTGEPKGVMVPHRTLIEHQRLAHEIFRRTGEQITVSWLPFYHDMGLIGSLLYPLYTGGHTVLMPPTSFIRRPMQWLHNITKYRAAVSTAPNFAYELCIRRSTEEDLERLDLSCWELTVCGAEPLRASTLERFTERFGRCGFRVETFLPCYGGAEATLTMSGGDVTAAPVIRSFDAAALRENRVVEAEPENPGTRRYVACGQPMQEHELRVVDPDSRQELPEDRVGELWLRGPSIASGYWGQAERTAEAFAATLPEVEGAPFMRTGDLGFWHDGEVYVIGRLADRLVIDGKRHEPHDLELTIEDAEPSLVYGAAAAIDPGQKGELWFVAEVRKTTDPEDLDRIGAEIREILRTEHDVEATKVLLVPPRIVPRTSSGKIRRHAYAQMLGTGELVPLWQG
jgi:acyl-CoA synthetase (AMP-forming)/AMP-acid ligase II